MDGMDLLTVYRVMKEDTKVLDEAFSQFKNNENVRDWHTVFHELYERDGQGQWIAMKAMQAGLSESVRHWGLGNQAKMHENMEGFIAWSLSPEQRNLEWRWAAKNVLCFMQGLGKMMETGLPWDMFTDINDEWDILRMQEKLNSIKVKDDREFVACRVWY